MEPAKYEKGIEWIRKILFQTVFTLDRIKNIATKLFNKVAEYKRDGNSLSEELMNIILFKPSKL